MKRNLTIGILLFSILFTSCTNFFHNIIPPQEGEIINFQLEYTNGSRSVLQTPDSNNNITITVPADTDITNLIPVVKLSEKAEIIPGTLPYLAKIFPEKDLLTLALDMYTANQNGTFKTWFLNLVLENDGIKIPKLEMPIDFTTPVLFIVISGQGNYKFYTVTVKKESDNNNNNDENQNDNNNDDSQEKDYENLILSFEVPSQIAESVIEHTVTGGNNEIIQDSNNLGDSVPYSGIVTFEVDENTNLKEILPIVTVSEGANVLPLTQNYLLSLGLSFEQILQFYSGYSTTSDVEKYIYSFIKKLDNITYPSLDMPINFYDTQVYFAVISANKDVKIYYINCKIKNIQPKLLNIAFSKTNNPLLIKDSKISIESQQITLSCLYPMDMELDYNLVADFVFDGDRVTYTMPTADEVEMISGVTKIPFTNNQRTCTITVYKSTKEVKYELVCPIELDPDSIRSITDFRFYKSKNTDIKKTVIASIYNEGDIGFISASVLYEGDVPPFELIPDFVTPGVVTKEGVEVISGNTCENFEYKTQYLCTSKNGLYCRLYDISIEFVQIVTEEPVITSFEFPVYLNKDLSKDAVATIDDLTNTIRCEILYFTEKPPYNLTPVFASNGEVTCNSIIQTSGFSEESFKYTTYYVVTTGTEEKITKRYRVDVSFVKDSSSSCDILDFTFESKNNATLSSDVQATVTERTKSIFAFMPYGAGSQSGTLLTPTFTSNGTVSVNGQTQTSGISSQDFSSPVTYTVTSANGLYTKEYVVSLQESGSIIYVDKNAVGRNNGTSWDDAFINLDLALEQAALIPAESAAEIWVTAPEDKTYISTEETGFKLHKEGSITILGGFDGTEQNASERQFDSNGNLLKRTKIQNYNNGTNGIFECNYLIKDYVYIEGFANTENNCEQFFYCIPTTGIYPTEPSFKDSNITINDCEFYAEEISHVKKNSYELTISNSKTHRIYDWKTNAVCNYNIENCTFLETKIAYVHVYSRGGIKFNNNTMYGSTDITLTDVSDAIIEFENNELLKSDKIEIKQLDYFTGNEIVIEEPVWYLWIRGNCNLFFSNMTFKNLLLGRGAVAEVNNCDFICASVNNSSSSGSFNCENESEVIVNNSRFNNTSITRYEGNLILNNCEVSYKMDGTVIRSSGNGTLTINNGVYNLSNTFDNYLNAAIELDGGNIVINNAEMNIQSNVNNQGIKFARGDITINDGVYNFNFTQGYCMKFGYYTNSFPRVNINGGIFNFETSGSAYSFYANCDVTISNAKFNFTGDEYNSSYCAYFTNGTNGSTIKNCEFIIDKCARGGFYANQAGLKIENSKFDINVYPQNSGDTCYGFNAYKDFSIDGGTFNFETSGSAYSFYANCDVTISNAKFNFTGDEYNSSYCAYFTNGTNGSTIKNCEFIIDKCARGGFYANQAGLKIENSKFDINLYSSDKEICGFYASKNYSIIESTLDITVSSPCSPPYIISNAFVNLETSVIENCVIDINSSGSGINIYDYNEQGNVLSVSGSKINIDSNSDSFYGMRTANLIVDNSYLSVRSPIRVGFYRVYGQFNNSTINIDSSVGFYLEDNYYSGELILTDCEIDIKAGMNDVEWDLYPCGLHVGSNCKLNISGGSLYVLSPNNSIISSQANFIITRNCNLSGSDTVLGRYQQ